MSSWARRIAPSCDVRAENWATTSSPTSFLMETLVASAGGIFDYNLEPEWLRIRQANYNVGVDESDDDRLHFNASRVGQTATGSSVTLLRSCYSAVEQSGRRQALPRNPSVSVESNPLHARK